LPLESLVPGEYVKLYPLFDPAAKTLSIRPAAVDVGLDPSAVGPSEGISTVNPLPKVDE